MSFPNKTAAHFYKTCYILFLLGSPNFWIEDLKCSKRLYKMYRLVSRVLNIVISCLVVCEVGGFTSQRNLTKKQETDMIVNSVSHPVVWSYSWILWKHRENIKKLLSDILRLKSFYNDIGVEEKLLMKSNRHLVVLTVIPFVAVFLRTMGALEQYIKSEATFTIVITVWPLVDDPSPEAHVGRVILNIALWMFMTRLAASFMTIVVLMTAISHQYMNLQSYFYSIEDIFKDRSLEQREMEIKYEESFKLGIKLHLSTVKCVDQFRNICKGIFSAHVCNAMIMLVFLMTQMMVCTQILAPLKHKSERTLMNTAGTVGTSMGILICTGFLFWNAGDVTEEAAELPTAMYSSGWHNCHGEANVRVRKLVLIAMTHAQKPVIITALGIIELSYKSYVALVKFSYSVFSVL